MRYCYQAHPCRCRDRPLPIGSIALRQSSHYINKVFLFFDKRQVAALFERNKLRRLEEPNQLPADAPVPNIPLHLYIVE
jgi:hypothetical protein